ncbi:MAG: ABC transporter substrate-binding protein [Spirochaetota bacterium]
MKKFRVLLLSSIVAFLSLTFGLELVARGAASGGGSGVKIGFIGPMTGDYANYGQLQSKGAQLAIEDFNKKEGGIGGQPVQLVVEDSQGKVEKGSAATQKLINVDKIQGLVGPVFSGVALAIAPDFQNAQIPIISASATSAEFTEKGDYIFRTVPSDALQSSILGPYIAEKLGFSTLAILFTKNDYSQSLAESVTQTYEKAGGKVLLSLGSPEGTKDFRSQLTQIKDAAPQAIFLPNYVAECAQIIKQLSEMGANIPIISADGFSNPEVFDLLGELANGVIFSASPSNETSDALTFQKRYMEQFKVDPDDFSANIYDGTTILLHAIKANYNQETQQVDKNAVRQAIQNMKGFPGVSGSIEFAANGDVKKGFAIKIAKNGKFDTQGIYTVESGRLQELK